MGQFECDGAVHISAGEIFVGRISVMSAFWGKADIQKRGRHVRF
jgi:hypothetical protein